MAAVLDISILNSFTIVIVFLLVFIGGWGILTVANPFKDKGKSFYGLLAFLVALIVVISRKVVSVILFATPWVIVVALVAFFFIFFAKMFNVGDTSISIGFKENIGWFIFFLALIMVFAIGTTFGPDLLPATMPSTGTPGGAIGTTSGNVSGVAGGGTATADFGTNLTLTLFHPKIIGVLFLFLLGTLTILLLAKN